MKVNKISINSGKAHIVTSLALIGVSLIGIAQFMADGKYAVSGIWFPSVLIIGIWGLVRGIKIYRGQSKKEKGMKKIKRVFSRFFSRFIDGCFLGVGVLLGGLDRKHGIRANHRPM